MTNLKDLFNPGGFAVPAAAHNADEYKVSFKEGKGGVYTSVIRFVPYVPNPSKSLISKQISYVKNPITNQSVYVDDPRSIGQKSPIVDMFFTCWNTNNEQIRNFAKAHISTKQQYAALVQIIKDDQHPELNGKIKVFRFGKKLFDKLDAEQKGIMGNGINPFHPIFGRYFAIKCVSQSGFNNFDQSSFFDAKTSDGRTIPSGVLYAPNPAEPDKLAPVTEMSDQQAVADWLAANSPDLSKYDYTPWSAQDDKFINETLGIIANYLEKGTLQSNMQTVNTAGAGIPVNTTPVFPGAQMPSAPQSVGIQSTYQGQLVYPTQTPVAPVVESTPSPSVNLGGLQIGSVSIDRPASAPQMPTPAPSVTGIDLPNVGSMPAGPTAPAPGIGGNLDDIIAQL